MDNLSSYGFHMIDCDGDNFLNDINNKDTDSCFESIKTNLSILMDQYIRLDLENESDYNELADIYERIVQIHSNCKLDNY